MELADLTEIIIKTKNDSKIAFVSICGAADTGKSTLASQICHELKTQNIECDYICTDSFMIDRAERKFLGFSGYNLKSLKHEKLLSTLNCIENKKKVKYYPYDNKSGKISNEYRIVNPVEILIMEGIHSFNEIFIDKFDLKIFIESDVHTLKKLRFKANINKRGVLENMAGDRIDQELEEYYRFVEPNRKYADITIRIDENYNYH